MGGEAQRCVEKVSNFQALMFSGQLLFSASGHEEEKEGRRRKGEKEEEAEKTRWKVDGDR